MGRTLAEFSAEIKKRHVAKSSKFAVYLSPPKFMTTNVDKYPNSKETVNLVQLFADAVHFPEIVIETLPIRDDSIRREVPYDKMYPPIVCSFICDAGMSVKKFFDDWVMGIMKTETGTFRYQADYMIEYLDIVQFNENKEDTYTVTLKNVYPKLVNDISLSTSSREYNRCQVQFVYKTWESSLMSTRPSTIPVIKAKPTDVWSPVVPSTPAYVEILLNDAIRKAGGG